MKHLIQPQRIKMCCANGSGVVSTV